MARNQYYSDEDILEGFRRGDTFFFHRFFYEYCRVAYNIYDQRYELSRKENLDFMSLAHQYALYLMEHDWRPLEDHSPQVSLRTWMVNGFRYIVLDALKWYQREYGSITLDDYMRSFDPSADMRLEFNRVVEEICEQHLMPKDGELVRMLLIEGYANKEVAKMRGVTPSAISQQYKGLLEHFVKPYLYAYFDVEPDMPEIMDMPMEECGAMAESEAFAPTRLYRHAPSAATGRETMETGKENVMETGKENIMETGKKRTTPERITELAPNEIFVFGSNLRGMHGGGAAWTAYRYFGAIMGQGVGLQGQSYGIPTMQGGVETIRPYVDEFIQFAKSRPDLTFLVTRIGCGIAGFRNSEIAPLFEEAHTVDNIVLPEGW